jgi:hypothetical protein
MMTFVAKDDTTITETYEDETGASATVLGNLRVPFTGRLRFTLSQNGIVLETIEKKTPVLLAGKDETVEISWNKTLNPGIYQLIGPPGQQRQRERCQRERLLRPNLFQSLPTTHKPRRIVRLHLN